MCWFLRKCSLFKATSGCFWMVLHSNFAPPPSNCMHSNSAPPLKVLALKFLPPLWFLRPLVAINNERFLTCPSIVSQQISVLPTGGVGVTEQFTNTGAALLTNNGISVTDPVKFILSHSAVRFACTPSYCTIASSWKTGENSVNSVASNLNVR